VTYGGNFVLGRPCTKSTLRSLRASISWHFTFLKQFLKEVSCIALSKHNSNHLFLLLFFPKSGYIRVSFLLLFGRSEVYLRMLLLFFVWVAASLVVEGVIPRTESASAPGREKTDDADSAEEETDDTDSADEEGTSADAA